MECEHPLALFAAFFGFCSGVLNCRCGYAGKVSLIFHNDLKGVVGVEQVLVEFDVEVGKLVVDFLEFLFVGVGKKRPVAHEFAVCMFECAHLVMRQAEGVAVIVECLDTVEQAAVHHKLV